MVSVISGVIASRARPKRGVNLGIQAWKVNMRRYACSGPRRPPATSQTTHGATARPRSSWVTVGHGDSRAQDNPSATQSTISGVAVLMAAASAA